MARLALSILGAAVLHAVVSASVALAQPTLDTAGAATCVVAEPIELGTSAVRSLRLGVAFTAPDRGLVAWTDDVDHLRARPLAAGSAPGDAITVELRHANGLEVLAPARDGFLALSSGSMCDDIGNSCFHARALRADGSPAGPALDEPGHSQEPDVPHWAAVPDGIAVAQVWRWNLRLARYTVRADGTVALEPQPQSVGCPGGQPFDAIASEGARVEVLTNSICDFPRYRIPLPGDAVLVHGIPTEDTVRIVRAVLDGDDLWVVFRAGAARPQLARIGADGRVTSQIAIAADTPLPAALADRVHARTTLERGRVMLIREDAAGRAIGSPVELARGAGARTEHAVAWDGSAFVTVWATRARTGWTIRMRRIVCG